MTLNTRGTCSAVHRSPYSPFSNQKSKLPSTFTFLYLTEVVVEGGVAPIDDPGGEGGGEGGAEGDGEPAHEDLVHLLPGGEPLVGLTLPLLGAVPLVDIVGELRNMFEQDEVF